MKIKQVISFLIAFSVGKQTTENIALAGILLLEKWLDNEDITFYTMEDIKRIYKKDLLVSGQKFISFIPK